MSNLSDVMDKTSIIIINYNSSAFIMNLITSINEKEKFGSYEIIIIDNNSDDNGVEILNKLESSPFLKIIKLENNIGFAAANNIGFKVATGKYLLLLNPDTLMLENSLSKVIEYRESINKPCIIGIKLLNPDSSYQDSVNTFPNIMDYFYVAFFLNKIFKHSKILNRYNYGWKSREEIGTVDSVKGAFLFLDKDVYLKLGGLDENFFLFSEEMDLCYRAKMMGIDTIYLPITSIIHYGGQSIKNQPLKKHILLYQSMLIFMNKHRGYLYTLFFRMILVILTFNRFLVYFILSFLSKDRKVFKNKSMVLLRSSYWLLKNYLSLTVQKENRAT